MVQKVVVNFGSQANVLLREIWINMGRPNLHKTTNYLKLVDQRFIEPIKTLRQVQTSIMEIPMIFKFQVINLVDGILTYPTLVDRSWG